MSRHLEALKAHRRQLIDPMIAGHHGRIVKTTGDGATRRICQRCRCVGCAVVIQRGMISRNLNLAEDNRIVFRIGINVGDIIIDGDESSGMASILLPAWKPFVNREGCASHARPTTKSGTSCRSPLPIWASRRSRIFPVRSASLGSPQKRSKALPEPEVARPRAGPASAATSQPSANEQQIIQFCTTGGRRADRLFANRQRAAIGRKPAIG